TRRSSDPIDATRLEAIGVTNQRETTLFWDPDSMRPIQRAIVWQDRRTTDRIEQLEEAGKAEEIQAKTGLEPDPYFAATKAEWLLDNADPTKLQRSRPADLRARAEAGELTRGP